MTRQTPNANIDVVPSVILNPVGIDALVKDMQAHLLSEVTWLERSFNRATVQTNIDADDNETVFPKGWIADGKDEYELIGQDNWNAYSFFVARGTESVVEYNEHEDSVYERELSLYVWINLPSIQTTDQDGYFETLKQDILVAIRSVQFSDEYGIEVTGVEDDIEEVFSGFTLDTAKTQMISYPYRALRIDMDAKYNDKIICDSTATIPAPTGLLATLNGFTQIDLTWTDNTAGSFDSYEIWRSVNDGAFALYDTTINAGSYDDLVVVAGSEYNYMVRAEEGGSFSAFSNRSAETVPYQLITSVVYTNNGNSYTDVEVIPDFVPTVLPAGQVEYFLINAGDTLPSFFDLDPNTGVISDNLTARTVQSYSFAIAIALSGTIAACETITVTITASGAWTPADGLEAGSIVVGFDFAKNVTSAGGKVSSVASDSGEVVNATQVTGFRQPATTTLSSGKAAVFFAGQSWLNLTLSADISPEMNMFIGVETGMNDVSQFIGLLSFNDAFFTDSGGETIIAKVGGVTASGGGLTPVIQQGASCRPLMIRVRYKSADHLFELDAGSTFSATSSTVNTNDFPATFVIGNSSGGSSSTAKIAQLLITQGAITETDITNIETYISTDIGSGSYI